MHRFVDSRLRGNDGLRDYEDLQDWDDALHRFHPHSRVRHWDRLWSSAVKGEGDSVGCFVLLSPHPVDTALKPV